MTTTTKYKMVDDGSSCLSDVWSDVSIVAAAERMNISLLFEQKC